MSVRKSARLPVEALQPCLLPLPDPLAPLDWREIFGNELPVELEVGFGKGLFLLNEACSRPHVNFAGIEIVRKYQLLAATRVIKRNIANIRLACGDGKLFVAQCVPAASLAALHVYFPDPWWKKRHHKRRVFTEDFVASCANALQMGGYFHVATDVPDYAEVIAGLLGAQSGLRPMRPPNERAPTHEMDYLTNFERKFRKEGKPIHRFRFQRTVGGEP